MIVTAIDFETANRHPASVCALGAAVLEYGSIEEKISTLICPEKNVGWFSRQNIAVHGIYPEDVKDAPTFPEVYRMLEPYLDDALIAAHNARFDMACLKEACLNCSIPLPTFRYFDTVELARRVFPHLEHHRLNDVCEHLGFDLDHHKADSDAMGCLMIVVQAMNLTGVYDPEEMLSQCNTRIYEF
ncbi:MAG: 3'-5' exonuclease [Solobacterium sp.]|nr:3'-5' exonuclease [Solobacterium sp.]